MKKLRSVFPIAPSPARVRSPRASLAFDISQEPASIAKLFSDSPLSQSCLLATRLVEAGLVVSGTFQEGRLVEIVELPDHPWFVASQFHPEFKSRPTRPAPLFREFVGAALEREMDRLMQSLLASRRG